MAFRRGRGPTAVPVRSALLGAVFGVLGVTAVLTFSSSLSHLVATPRLYGWTYDFSAKDNTFSTPCKGADFGLLRQPGIGAVAEVCETFNLVVDRRPVNGYAFASLRGSIGPEVITGRAPRGPREIALGSGTLRALHKSIGDTVQARGTNAPLTYTIVGRIALSQFGQGQALADGAAFTRKGLSPLFDPVNLNRFLVGRFARGSNHAAVAHRIAAISKLDAPIEPTVAVEVDRLRQIGWFPATLAALLGGLALLAVGHALVTAVRRRRRELALAQDPRLQPPAGARHHCLASHPPLGLVVGFLLGLLLPPLLGQCFRDCLGLATIPIFLPLPLLVVPVGALASPPSFFSPRGAPEPATSSRLGVR